MLREIRDRLEARPFRPFSIHLADGRRLDVPHPEFLWIGERGEIYLTHGGDPTGERLNTLLIVSIAPLLGPQKARRR